jgi:hypothetical protein
LNTRTRPRASTVKAAKGSASTSRAAWLPSVATGAGSSCAAAPRRAREARSAAYVAMIPASAPSDAESGSAVSVYSRNM